MAGAIVVRKGGSRRRGCLYGRLLVPGGIGKLVGIVGNGENRGSGRSPEVRIIMTTLTPEQHQAIIKAGGSSLAMTDPHTNLEYVLVRADIFRRMQDTLNDAQAARQEKALTKAAIGWSNRHLLNEA